MGAIFHAAFSCAQQSQKDGKNPFAYCDLPFSLHLLHALDLFHERNKEGY
jgi:hypothetical protein